MAANGPDSAKIFRTFRFFFPFRSDLQTQKLLWLDCTSRFFDRLRHSFYECHLALNGKAAFHIENSPDIELPQASFLLIPPSCSHEYSIISNEFQDFVAGFQLEFNENNINGLFLKYAFDHYKIIESFPATECMIAYIRDIEKSAYLQEPGTSAIAESNFQLLLLRMAQIICPYYIGPHNDHKNSIYDSQFKYIQQYIQGNLELQLTSDLVAHEMNMSTKELNRLLQSNYHTTISQMIQNAKLAAIKNYLISTDLTFEQIAEKTGFSNGFNMSRFFKQAEGMSPKIYQKSLLGLV